MITIIYTKPLKVSASERVFKNHESKEASKSEKNEIRMNSEPKIVNELFVPEENRTYRIFAERKLDLLEMLEVAFQYAMNRRKKLPKGEIITIIK